ncbi:MAG: hydantoinase B/oxoprolinase family protein, partial [Syntrophobacterales bacterium]
RRKLPPYGLQGGGPGAVGKNIIFRKGKRMEKPGKFSASLHKGEIVRIETPGGGGYGKKGDRSQETGVRRHRAEGNAAGS